MEEWNRELNVPYWEYRNKLKEIAQKTLRRTGTPVLMREQLGASPDRIIIPMDDDDWLHPDIEGCIMPFFQDPKVKIVCWDNALLYFEDDKVVTRVMPSRSRNLSCNYAIRASMPRRCWYEHYKFENYRKRNEKVVRHCDGPLLSMWLRHYGSVGEITKKIWMKSRWQEGFPLLYGMPDKVPPRFEWCKSYWAELLEYSSKIRRKAIKLL